MGKRKELRDYVTPVGSRMLVSKPKAIGRSKVKQSAGEHGKSILLVASEAEERREYGSVAKVFKVGEEVTKYHIGDTVLLAQFAGIPIFTDAGETPTWIVTEDEVLARVSSNYWQDIHEAGDDSPRGEGGGA